MRDRIGQGRSARGLQLGTILSPVKEILRTESTRPRIAALVLNSVNHDARVLKEADSLAEAGFDVHVIGIQDNRCGDRLTRRSENVSIHRVELGPHLLLQRYRIRSRLFMFCAIMMFMLVLLVLLTPLRSMVNHFSDHLISIGILPILIAGGASLAAVWFLSRCMRARRSVRIKQREINAGNAVPGMSNARSKPSAKGPLGVVNSVFATVHQYRKQIVASKVFRAELDRLGPQAVHCHDLPMLPIGARWCDANPSVFLVFDSHELYEEVSQMHPLKRRVWQRTLRTESSKVDAFITVNDSIAEEHARRYPLLPPAVVVKNATITDGRPLTRTGLLRDAAGVGRQPPVEGLGGLKSNLCKQAEAALLYRTRIGPVDRRV